MIDALAGNPGAGRPVRTHQALPVGLQQPLRGCVEARGLLITPLRPLQLLTRGLRCGAWLERRNHPRAGEPFHCTHFKQPYNLQLRRI